MELDINNTLFRELIKLADRFSCVVEMATYLAMLAVGGPKRFFLWYCDAASWHVIGNGTVPKMFQPTFSLCTDDLELALLLMRCWLQAGSTERERKEWARDSQVNHAALLYSVQQKRDQLLFSRIVKKEEIEDRPVDLRLLLKLRLLLAYHLVKLARDPASQQADLAIKGGIYHGSIGRQTMGIHRDSICCGRELAPFLYFSFALESGGTMTEAQQVITIPHDWLKWLEQEERSVFALPVFVVGKTRLENSVDIPLQRNDQTQPKNRPQQFLKQDLSSLLKPFAHSRDRGEDVEIEPYYGRNSICGINEPAPLVVPDDFQQGAEYLGTIVDILPDPHNLVIVEFKGGLRGTLHVSRIWGRYSDISANESIRIGVPIKVLIKSVDKKRRMIELDAHLPALNPFNEFEVGQVVYATVVSVERKYMLVDIHPKIPPVQCRCNVYIEDMRDVFFPDDQVKVFVDRVIPEEETIEVIVAPKDQEFSA